MLGDIYFAIDNMPRAEKAYQKAFELEPEYFNAANNIGVVKAMQNDIDAAEKYFKKALIIYPLYEKAGQNLKRCSNIKSGESK